MKKVRLFLLALLCPVVMWAQDGINYQAVVRDGAGAILVNQQVDVNFKIRENNATGTVVYEESYNPTTNDYGLINLVIGEGSAITGVFTDIDWGSTVHFLEVTIDGNSLGALEFRTVPYAYHANSLPNVRTNTTAGDVQISSDDDHARLFLNPTAALTNDSSTVVFGEGSNETNYMKITYDGTVNEMRFSGNTNGGGYSGPYLTISRDAGTSTFSNGVEVEETTQSPEPNTLYGNSGPLAYGYFSGTNITTEFGISSITSSGVGVFAVTLDNAWLGSPVVVATSLNNSADTESITYSTTGNNIINIRIVDENNNPVTSNFSMVVYGIAQ